MQEIVYAGQNCQAARSRAQTISPVPCISGLSGGPSISHWVYLNRSQTTSLFTTISWLFGDSSYNNFFYGANNSSIYSDFKANSGEISRRVFSRIAFNLSNRLQLFVGGFFANLKKSRNLKSPLIERQNNSGFALGFLWNFYQSDKTTDFS